MSLRVNSEFLRAGTLSHSFYQCKIKSNWCYIDPELRWLIQNGNFFLTLVFFFLKTFIYLFIWLHRVLVVAGGLLNCGSWAP